jgi:hypothetical protein
MRKITKQYKQTPARGADCAPHTKFRFTVNPAEKQPRSLNCGFLNSTENF